MNGVLFDLEDSRKFEVQETFKPYRVMWHVKVKVQLVENKPTRVLILSHTFTKNDRAEKMYEEEQKRIAHLEKTIEEKEKLKKEAMLTLNGIMKTRNQPEHEKLTALISKVQAKNKELFDLKDKVINGINVEYEERMTEVSYTFVENQPIEYAMYVSPDMDQEVNMYYLWIPPPSNSKVSKPKTKITKKKSNAVLDMHGYYTSRSYIAEEEHDDDDY
jgi:hypothetical protein